MSVDQFMAAIAAAQLSPAKPLDLPDGELVRYRVQGDKSGSRNGWAVLHRSSVLAGAFGSWRTGEQHTWRAETDRRLTKAEAEALRRQQLDMQRLRRAEQDRVHQEARARAEGLWRTARPATHAHPYLLRKGVPSLGVRQLRDRLVIPARDAAGQLHTLQFIGADGAKRFLTGGRIAGCYYALGRPAGLLLLCEGFATGATLFTATHEAVAVAFNAGNLAPVARVLRQKFPRARILVCADDDRHTPGNPGLTAATAAAREVGGQVVAPAFMGMEGSA